MDLRRILNDDSADNVVHSSVAQTVDFTQGRVGKWSPEEERYAAALITYFMDGTLSIAAGTSLRSFLANKLRCSAMRVSTKLSMDSLDGRAIPKRLGQKRFFPRGDASHTERRRIEREIQDLEMAFYSVENLDDGKRFDHVTTATRHGDENAPQRVGSWSHEEQAYACALIDAFLRGHVELQEGVTLRAYLADRLSCNPMRVSKKLATGKMATMVIPRRLGSTMYHRQVFDAGLIAHSEYELTQLRLGCFPTSSGMKSTCGSLREASPVFTPPGRRARPEGSMEIDPAHACGRFLPIESPVKKRKLSPLEFPASPIGLPALLLDMHNRVTTHY